MSHATSEGTETFVAKAVKSGIPEEHFRPARDLRLSTIGLGTYLGAPDDETDASYFDAIRRAAELGCNVFDTASNYRFQRSERVLGRAIRELVSNGLTREEMVVATKGGYIPFDGEAPEDPSAYVREHFIEPGLMKPEEMTPSGHSLAPEFLRHQIRQSLKNLGLDCLDIYYLHNPESQLSAVSREEWRARMRRAMAVLEEAASEGQVVHYGMATWNGCRAPADSPEHVSIADTIALAKEVAGENHRFRFVQAPYNLAMTECLTELHQTAGEEAVSVFRAAEEHGLTVVSSASIAQGRLTTGLPDWLGTLFKGMDSDVQRSIQFVRSTPGLTSALIGMKTEAHVEENMSVARVPPAPVEDFLKLFEVDSSNT